MPPQPTKTTSTTTTTMSTQPPCPIPSPVTNAQPPTVYSDGRTAEYTCSVGFQMSGSARIHCHGTPLSWHGTLPSCHQIDYTPNYPIWLWGLAAGLLGLMALTGILCLLAYCCGWGGGSSSGSGCRCCGRRRRIHGQLSDTRGDGIMQAEESMVYYIPMSERNVSKDNRQKDVRHLVLANPRSQQNLILEEYTDPHGVLVSGKDTSSKQKLWLPHTHGIRPNNDITR